MIQLPSQAAMRDYQNYIYQLETLHGWLDVDLVHNCFLMGEEMGELFKAIRHYNRLFPETARPLEIENDREHVAEEIVDVLNYLIAIANRLDIDIEAAFRQKNAKNQERNWDS